MYVRYFISFSQIDYNRRYINERRFCEKMTVRTMSKRIKIIFGIFKDFVQYQKKNIKNGMI